MFDWPLTHAGLLVKAGPHNIASQWSFPCTASGGFKIAWQRGSDRGCEEGARITRSGARSQGQTDPNGESILGAKGILKAQGGGEEVIVAPPSSDSSIIQTYESANGIEVETILGNILVKSAKYPQGRLIPEGQRYSYPQDSTMPIDRNAIANSREMQDFLNPNNWSSPDLPPRVADGIGQQLGEMRTALGQGSPVAGNLIAIASGSGRITRSEYPNVVPVGTSVSQVNGAYNPSAGKILLEIEGRQAEITLNAPLTDGTPIPFTVTGIIARAYDPVTEQIYGSQYSNLAKNSIKRGVQSQGTLIKQGERIQGSFTAKGVWYVFGQSATTGSVDGEFVLNLQPGLTGNTLVSRVYALPVPEPQESDNSIPGTGVRAGW
ncbi:hypothetical protein [[Phormidium] sp. ETS-05]|uniref:hypothetical protein n=1 Tax=[Phormidium] sp. ETS-05 TaxID=222819 RepID=UPI0018EF25B9|nr:hypothetical protein [[Phormidium] sp. ETS-05]